jgi:tRNA(Ile2) C34 agmatinyltransferase TiaS
MKRCGATLHYEHFQGMRLYKQVGRKKLYNFRCPECGAAGANNGRDLTCREVKKGHVPGQARRDHLVQG